MCRIIAIANQKGGVGKTTTAVNLSSEIAKRGHKTLLVDMDSQANTTASLIGINEEVSSMSEVLIGECSMGEIIQQTSIKNLDLAPSAISLANTEVSLIGEIGRELTLRRCLTPVVGSYKYIFIDCPPSLGVFTINALAAASEVFIPIQTNYLSLIGTGQLINTIRLIKEMINPGLRVSKVIITFYDSRTRLSQDTVSKVKEFFSDGFDPGVVSETFIPRTVKLEEAPIYQLPIADYVKSSPGAEAYRLLSEEVIGIG